MKSQAYHRSFLHRQWFKKGVLYMQEHNVGEGHLLPVLLKQNIFICKLIMLAHHVYSIFVVLQSTAKLLVNLLFSIDKCRHVGVGLHKKV